jgi:hypothetical protein
LSERRAERTADATVDQVEALLGVDHEAVDRDRHAVELDRDLGGQRHRLVAIRAGKICERRLEVAVAQGSPAHRTRP